MSRDASFPELKYGVKQQRDLDGANDEAENIAVHAIRDEGPYVDIKWIIPDGGFEMTLYMPMKRDAPLNGDILTAKQWPCIALEGLDQSHLESCRCL